MGTLVESLIQVYSKNDSFETWQFTLITIAFMLVAVLVNTYGARILPALETISLLIHTAGFIIVVVALWVLCPRNSASTVFGEVVNGGGWSSVGVSCMVGHTALLYTTLGMIAHVSFPPAIRTDHLQVLT